MQKNFRNSAARRLGRAQRLCERHCRRRAVRFSSPARLAGTKNANLLAMTFVAQVEQALRNIVQVLAEADGQPEPYRATDLVRDRQGGICREAARDRRRLPPRHRAAFSRHDADRRGGTARTWCESGDRSNGGHSRVMAAVRSPYRVVAVARGKRPFHDGRRHIA